MLFRSSHLEFAPLLEILSRVRSGLALLVLLTVVLPTWQHYGMERVVTFTVANRATIAGADSDVGGASSATIAREGAIGKLHCHLVEKFQWPYCRMRMLLGTMPQGMDLTGFTHMSLDVGIEGGGKHAIRAQLIDFERGISDPTDWESMKINEVDGFKIPGDGKADIGLNLFYTPTWWKTRIDRPLDQKGVALNNVVSIDLLTDSENRHVDQIITLRAIRFHGKWISMTTMLIILVGAWMLAAIGWPMMAALTVSRQLGKKHAELAMLNEVNKALQLEAKDLVGQAHTDPLTGVLNRQGLRAALMNTSNMLSDPVCIVFMDIDHFKRINDLHGHDAGDDVLRGFAEVISKNIRTSDKLVRWGGEEFLLVCSNTSLVQAAALGEKLRLALRQHPLALGLHVTASFGVAQLHSQEDFSDVIKRADRALYGAKSGGRDRVHVDGLDEPDPANSPQLLRA